MQTPRDAVKTAATARLTKKKNNNTQKKTHNALLCHTALSTLVCGPQGGLRGSMKMILVVSLEFGRCCRLSSRIFSRAYAQEPYMCIWGKGEGLHPIMKRWNDVRLVYRRASARGPACAPQRRRRKRYPSLIRRLWVSAGFLLAFYMECFHQDPTIYKSAGLHVWGRYDENVVIEVLRRELKAAWMLVIDVTPVRRAVGRRRNEGWWMKWQAFSIHHIHYKWEELRLFMDDSRSTFILSDLTSKTLEKTCDSSIATQIHAAKENYSNSFISVCSSFCLLFALFFWTTACIQYSVLV